jgi:hypothetical protein
VCVAAYLWRCTSSMRSVETPKACQHPAEYPAEVAQSSVPWVHLTQCRVIFDFQRVAVVWLEFHAPPSLSTFPTFTTQIGKARPGEALSTIPLVAVDQRYLCTMYLWLADFSSPVQSSAALRNSQLGGEGSRTHADDHHSILSTCIRKPPASQPPAP